MAGALPWNSLGVGFRYLPSLYGNDGSNAGRSGKIDLLDGGVGNQLTGEDTSILGIMLQGVEAASRKAGIVKSRGEATPHMVPGAALGPLSTTVLPLHCPC